ncbi:MAG TPA: (2Fe-2S) ferredoxin domain-containing protein [Planctomycetota bacterium]|nr:(2Fe-2S) ferredoxin domain-containing protein [Planctomycetota bacterium]
MKRKKLLKHFAAQKQVFVCCGKACGRKAGRSMRKSIKAELKARGHKKAARVIQCTCLGVCGDGVNVVVYPGSHCLINTTAHEVAETVIRTEDQDYDLTRGR